MLTKYKTYKALNESFGGAFGLGLKTTPSIGFMGSKLAEMGIKPGDEDGDDDLNSLLGDDGEEGEDNQDPNLEDDDMSSGEEDLGDDDLGLADDDDMAALLGHDSEGDDSELGDDGSELGDDELDADHPDDPTFTSNDLSDLHAALNAKDVGDDGMPVGIFGDDDGGTMDGEELGGMGDMGGGMGFGDDNMDDMSSLFQGQQGPGVPDFGDDDEFNGSEDSDEDNEDDNDDEDDSDEDDSEEDDFDDLEDSDEDEDNVNDDDEEDNEKAKAFSKKNSKKFMDKDYSKKFMKKGQEFAACGDKNENTQFFESLIGMGRGEVHGKFSSGMLKNEENVVKPTKKAKQLQPGDVGFAPSGKIGSISSNFPTVSDYLEARRKQKSITENGLNSLSRQDKRGMHVGELDLDKDVYGKARKGWAKSPIPGKQISSFAFGPEEGDTTTDRASPEDLEPGQVGRKIAPTSGGNPNLERIFNATRNLSDMERKLLVRKLLGH